MGNVILIILVLVLALLAYAATRPNSFRVRAIGADRGAA